MAATLSLIWNPPIVLFHRSVFFRASARLVFACQVGDRALKSSELSRARAFLAGAFLLLLASGASAQDTAPGIDFSQALEAAERMPRLYSLLVSVEDELVLERYFNGRDADDIANVKSVSKSLISALVGVAIDRGFIDGVDDPIASYFADRIEDDDKRAIRIEDLLTMQAGLQTTSNRNYGRWVQSTDWVDFALRQPLEDVPGERMQYSTGNTHLLSAILTQATGKDTLAFAREVLGDPLGFHLVAWPRDPQGIYFGGNDMELTPRQMLAFGRLYLNGGELNGREVVPSEWVRASFVPRTESPREEDRYYGYGWWIRDMAGYTTPYAWGYGGQFIALVPELDLVVVTTSSSYPGDDRRRHTRGIYDLLEYGVIRAVGNAARQVALR